MPIQVELVPSSPSDPISAYHLIEASCATTPDLLTLTPSHPFTLSADSELIYYNKDSGNFLTLVYVESGIFEKSKFTAQISHKVPITNPSPLSLPTEELPAISDGCTWKFLANTLFLQIGNLPQFPITGSFSKGVFSKRVKFFLNFPAPVQIFLDGEVFKSGGVSRKSAEISDHHEIHLANESGSVEGLVWFLVTEKNTQTFLSIKIDYPGEGLAIFYGAMPPDLTTAPLAEFSAVPGCTVSRKGSRTVELQVDINNCMHASSFHVVSATGVPSVPAGSQSESGALVLVSGAENLTEPTLLDRTRPKDAWSGVASGLKAIGGGLLAGTAALVVAPVVEVQERGAVGVFTGLAKGVGGFLGLGLGGAVAGIGQVVRGVANTPEAMRQDKFMKWDKEKGEWFDQRVDLDVLKKLFESEHANGGRGTLTYEGKKEVKDTRLYEVLELESTATTDEIKKAYRRKALELHPDKMGKTPEKKPLNFQELNQAYQVLVDPVKRKAYDAQGLKDSGGSLADEMDPKAFFSALFGGEKFHAYTGDLALASEAETLITEKPEDSFDVKRRAKLRREVTCALNVLEKLKFFVDDRDEAKFMSVIIAEALELASENFGPELLETLGFAYENRARQWLLDAQGERLERKWVSWKSTGKAIGRKAAMLSSIAKTALAAKRMQNAVNDANQAAEKIRAQAADAAEAAASAAGAAGPTGAAGGASGAADAAQKAAAEAAATHAAADVQEMFAEAFPQFLATVWDVSVIDIAKNAKGTAKKLLLDLSVPWQVLWRRAKALELLGRVWRGIGVTRVELAKRGNIQDVEKALHSSIRR